MQVQEWFLFIIATRSLDFPFDVSSSTWRWLTFCSFQNTTILLFLTCHQSHLVVCINLHTFDKMYDIALSQASISEVILCIMTFQLKLDVCTMVTPQDCVAKGYHRYLVVTMLICANTLYDVFTVTKLPKDIFPRRKLLLNSI